MENVISVSKILKARRKIIFWLIIICGLIVIFYISNFFIIGYIGQELLTNGLLMAAVTLPCLIALLPFTFISSIYFLWSGKGVIKVMLWFILNLVIFVMMVAPLYKFGPRGLWFLPFPISLAGTVLIFDSKDSFRKGYFIFLLVAMLLCLPMLLGQILPYIYSPPVLTKKSVTTYNKALSFLLERNRLAIFRMNIRDWILPDVEKVMTEDDLKQAMKIRDKLINIACYQFEKTSGLVLFYKHGNRIFPPGPGIVYSLSGANPNSIDSNQINELKPFENLAGNWYVSRSMTFVGPRIDILTKTPKALIDRSKVISGVSDEELHRFDNWQKQKDPNKRQEDSNETN